jgi:hypothetical protein
MMAQKSLSCLNVPGPPSLQFSNKVSKQFWRDDTHSYSPRVAACRSPKEATMSRCSIHTPLTDSKVFSNVHAYNPVIADHLPIIPASERKPSAPQFEPLASKNALLTAVLVALIQPIVFLFWIQTAAAWRIAPRRRVYSASEISVLTCQSNHPTADLSCTYGRLLHI